MDKNKLMEQLRKAVREVIQEELKHGKSSYDATKGISTTELRDEKGNVVGYIKHKETGTGKKGFVAGGRIGPKAAKAVTAEEKTTINIPVAAIPSYKKGEQPTVINPKTGEEEIESDVSSWAKALETRFGHLKRGQTASLKGDPHDVKESYTLEEWIGKLEEAGYSLEEGDAPDMGPDDDDDIALSVGFTPNSEFARNRAQEAQKAIIDAILNATQNKGNALEERNKENNEVYTLEEWIGMIEEEGYQLDEISIDKMVRARDARYYRAQQDAEKARELQKKVHSRAQWRLDHEAGQLRGWAQDERDKAKRTQAHIDRKLAARNK